MTPCEIYKFTLNLRHNPDLGENLSHIKFRNYPSGHIELGYKRESDYVWELVQMKDAQETIQVCIVLLRQGPWRLRIEEPDNWWRPFLLTEKIRSLLRM